MQCLIWIYIITRLESAMSKIDQNINHLKTFLAEVETYSAKLKAGQRSAAPRARSYSQKMRNILGDLRKDLQEESNKIPVKSRAKKTDKENEAPSEPTPPPAEEPTEQEPVPAPLPLKRSRTKARASAPKK